MVYRIRENTDEGDLETGTRVCTACGHRRAMSEYHWANGKLYRRRKCKPCVYARSEEVRRSNLDQYRTASRRRTIKRKYGLTLEAWEAMREQQGDRCAICRGAFSEDAIHVDHDHDTGTVRGLLCFTCNTALGKFHDDIGVLRAAIGYLEQARIGREDVA